MNCRTSRENSPAKPTPRPVTGERAREGEHRTRRAATLVRPAVVLSVYLPSGLNELAWDNAGKRTGSSKHENRALLSARGGLFIPFLDPIPPNEGGGQEKTVFDFRDSTTLASKKVQNIHPRQTGQFSRCPLVCRTVWITNIRSFCDYFFAWPPAWFG